MKYTPEVDALIIAESNEEVAAQTGLTFEKIRSRRHYLTGKNKQLPEEHDAAPLTKLRRCWVCHTCIQEGEIAVQRKRVKKWRHATCEPQPIATGVAVKVGALDLAKKNVGGTYHKRGGRVIRDPRGL